VLKSFARKDWAPVLEITVINYSDRMEITSLGCSANFDDARKMFAEQRYIHNPIIIETLGDHGYVDMCSMDVRCKIAPLANVFIRKDT